MSSLYIMYVVRNIVVDDLFYSFSFAFDMAVKVCQEQTNKEKCKLCLLRIRKTLNLTQISNNLSNEIYKEVKI